MKNRRIVYEVIQSVNYIKKKCTEIEKKLYGDSKGNNDNISSTIKSYQNGLRTVKRKSDELDAGPIKEYLREQWNQICEKWGNPEMNAQEDWKTIKKSLQQIKKGLETLNKERDETLLEMTKQTFEGVLNIAKKKYMVGLENKSVKNFYRRQKKFKRQNIRTRHWCTEPELNGKGRLHGGMKTIWMIFGSENGRKKSCQTLRNHYRHVRRAREKCWNNS